MFPGASKASDDCLSRAGNWFRNSETSVANDPPTASKRFKVSGNMPFVQML